MKVIVTGSNGFLGWHTRVRLRALTSHEVIAVDRTNWSNLRQLVQGADAIVHIAGVNRAADADVEDGNAGLALCIADAASSATHPPRIVFANSISAGADTPYGAGKARASETLARTAAELGSHYTDVRLPNLFGEHGRPHYNSFVATFVRAVANGATPEITDRAVGLLHVQRGAQSLIDALTSPLHRLDPTPVPTTVRTVFETLRQFRSHYSGGEIPTLDNQLNTDLFNTLRAALFPAAYPFRAASHSDARGRLTEAVRSHGGAGQTFVSTTRTGMTRGDHFHLSKVERFLVISGRARISLRRVLHNDVVTFDVRGDDPAIVDMPTLWAHNITNVGSGDLTTIFWSDQLFDPHASDTFAELVTQSPPEVSYSLQATSQVSPTV